MIEGAKGSEQDFFFRPCDVGLIEMRDALPTPCAYLVDPIYLHLDPPTYQQFSGPRQPCLASHMRNVFEDQSVSFGETLACYTQHRNTSEH